MCPEKGIYFPSPDQVMMGILCHLIRHQKGLPGSVKATESWAASRHVSGTPRLCWTRLGDAVVWLEAVLIDGRVELLAHPLWRMHSVTFPKL